ncbi:MAG: hypothetical protein ABR510_09665 [Trueperaceae bacterium]
MDDRRHVEPHPTREQARVQRTLRERARSLGLHVGFGQGRRSTDVTLVVVKGDRLAVLRALPKLFADLELDEEIVRSSQTPEGFEIVVALLQPRHRRTSVPGERRASELGDAADG